MTTSINKANDNFSSVGIIGCGWLGKALATRLLEKGRSVLATTSKASNVEQLGAMGINAQQLTLPTSVEQLIAHDIFAQHCLVIAIPPQFRLGKADYADKIALLVNVAQQRGLVQRIILVSSTAVYNDLAGQVNEDNALNLTTEKVQVLNQAEKIALNFSKQSNVLRLAGLVGPERHPGKFLLANKTLSNSRAPVNLIHQKDAVGLIESLLQEKYIPGIFNGVSDTHISKQEYYQAAATALALTLPTMSQETISNESKIVSGEKAKYVLGYKFVYPDLLTWL